MSRRSTVRRALYGTLLTTLTLLPLADAQAAPARKNERGAARIELSRLVAETVSQWAAGLVRMVSTDAPPPGHLGSDTSRSREGSGWDPHGRP